MTSVKFGPILHGWDDEKVYFWDDEVRIDWCVSDYPDLVARLVAICQEYFVQLKVTPGDRPEGE
ncbi:MAG: hypothetical protein CVU38_11430 [Chloroflexi bacterium HGW-Chloroflexi-1]|nr:MAG: hypothetical protein CVU38_11430 [Chloroflexi bacterium HGW-Chloroflexi-1]